MIKIGKYKSITILVLFFFIANVVLTSGMTIDLTDVSTNTNEKSGFTFQNMLDNNKMFDLRSTTDSVRLKNDGVLDPAYSIHVLSDGGYVIAGHVEYMDDGSHYAYLIKFNQFGKQEWFKQFPGLGLAAGLHFEQTSDGGFILTGCTAKSSDDVAQTLLIKTDTNGDIEWHSYFLILDGCQGNSVTQTTDWGYAITGIAYESQRGEYSTFVIKTDNLGNFKDYQTYLSDEHSAGYSIFQTNDKGFMFTVMKKNFGVYPEYTIIEDIYVVKIDCNLNMVWNKCFSGFGLAQCLSIQPTADYGYILAGQTYTGENNENAFVLLIKTDSMGNEVWNKTFSGVDDAVALSVQQTNDNGFIISGQTGRFQEFDANVLLLKTDENGVEEWSQTFVVDGYISCGYSVDQSFDSGYVLTGFSYGFDPYGIYDISAIILKTNQDGVEQWRDTFHWDNQPPESPTVLGSSYGKAGEVYYYRIASIDVDDDKVSYFIDWGDSTTTGWTDYSSSGKTIIKDHIWTDKATYIIRVKSRDINGEESDWTHVEVTMPVVNFPFYYLLLRFLENHPYSFPYLRYIMGI